MFILTFIRKLYKALSSDASPTAIAWAIAFGVVAGCVPVRSGLFFFMLALILVVRVQISTALFAWALTRLACVAGLARAFEGVGEKLLEADALRGFWTWFLNLPVIAWLGLDHLAILGGAVVGLVVGAVSFVPVRMLVSGYRRYVHEKVSQSKFFRWLTNFWMVKIFRFIFVGSSA